MKKRFAAEWEPAVGVMVGWPLNIPISLLREFSKDLHQVVLLIENEGVEADAKKQCAQWGIDTTKFAYVVIPSSDDACWPRDWGPHPIFDEGYILKMGCPQHVYSSPFFAYEGNGMSGTALNPYTEEELVPGEFISMEAKACAPAVAKALGYDWFDYPFSMTGGNVMSDGYNNLMSNIGILLENKLLDIDADRMNRLVYENTGMSNYSFMANYEDYGIQHIDCFLKLLDEERLLVVRLPKDHEHYERFENVVENYIKKMRNCHGRSYEILRIDTDTFGGAKGECAAYTNSIILNKTIYVPLYSNPKADERALETWKAAMPGYTIKGFTFLWEENDTGYVGFREHVKVGWFGDDALHCRTRAIWDRDMIYIHVDTLAPRVEEEPTYRIIANIVDYSRAGLADNELKLFWRVSGGSKWNETVMGPDVRLEWYAGEIINPGAGKTVEYYVSVGDNSGRNAARPVTAPEAWFRFTIVNSGI